MTHNFTCPNCGTKFGMDVPEGMPLVMCPACGTNIPIAVDEIGTVGDNIKQMAMREGNWILWAAGAFALVWGLVVLLMVMSSRHPAPAAVSSVPAPVVRPAPKPAPPPPIFNTSSAPTPAPAPAPMPVVPKPASKPVQDVRIVPHRAALTDADIVDAIHKGVDFLFTNFVNGELDPKLASDNISQRQGMNALAVYALLHCGQSTRDDRININSAGMKAMIERLKRMNISAVNDAFQPITYGRSLRASALAIYNRPEDRDVLSSDLAWLLRAEQDGAFGYDDVFLRKAQTPSKTPIKSPPGVHDPSEFRWDNSNSQYGLIGVWNCAEAGLSVPNKFWQDVEQHWVSSQTPLGTWDYQTGHDTRYAMTMAGITALSVCRDFMNDASTQPANNTRIAPRSEALNRAMAWFEAGDNSVNISGQYGYSLYGLERAALASGMMFVGTHDIYREVATQVLKNQHINGAWGGDSGRDAVIETSFSLLFLARGRNPVMVNKLRYDGNWANHQRDAANLARYASYAMEHPVNWQIATLTQPWAAWMEAPILYIAGDVPPNFGPADYERLRNYVDNGGLIFTHADFGSESFNAFARDLAAKLFPKYEMAVVNESDDLWSLQFQIPEPHPKVFAVSNGSRKLMVHSSDDIAGRWQASNPKRNQAAFELGLNLFVYTTGKAELRTKTDSPYILPPTENPGRYVPVARVQYAGNWDPEPAAWGRFVRYFWWETGWTLQPSPTPCSELRAKDFPVGYLTGTTADRATAADLAALRQFVQDGGTLFIDCCGGSRRFDDVVKQSWLPGICPGVPPQILADDDPIFTGKIGGLSEGPSELPRILLRPYTAQVSKPLNTRLLEARLGKGRLLFSEIDVTTGLLGTNTWGITGYSPAYAEALLKNVVLDSVSRADHKE